AARDGGHLRRGASAGRADAGRHPAVPHPLHRRAERQDRGGGNGAARPPDAGVTAMYDSKPFETLNVGDRVRLSKTITEADAALYIASTGDFGPVHVNDA